MTRKADLPTKLCVACGRPFAWRRKWAASWDEVRYCSDACRSGRRAAARGEAGSRRDAGGGDAVASGREDKP